MSSTKNASHHYPILLLSTCCNLAVKPILSQARLFDNKPEIPQRHAVGDPTRRLGYADALDELIAHVAMPARFIRQASIGGNP